MPTSNSGALIERNPSLRRTGHTALPRYQVGPVGKQFFNHGVSTFNRAQGVTRSARPGINNYYNASVQYAYGNLPAAKAELGDLFNDIMGAVVPGWDQRPQALKDIKVKADPAKIIQQAHTMLSPEQARKAAELANQYGVSATYKGVNLSPGLISEAWRVGGFGAAVAAVPMLYWVAGVGGIGLLYFMAKR